MTFHRVFLDLKKPDYRRLVALLKDGQSISNIIRVAVKAYLELNYRNTESPRGE